VNRLDNGKLGPYIHLFPLVTLNSSNCKPTIVTLDSGYNEFRVYPLATAKLLRFNQLHLTFVEKRNGIVLSVDTLRHYCTNYNLFRYEIPIKSGTNPTLRG
jgi:hypothetical protein